MKRSRTSIAILVIIALLATSLVAGSASLDAALFVALVVLVLTPTIVTLWDGLSATQSDTAERSLVLLRAPPL